MSDLPLPLLIAMVFFLLCWFLLRRHFRFQDEQAALPQREAYLAASKLRDTGRDRGDRGRIEALLALGALAAAALTFAE